MNLKTYHGLAMRTAKQMNNKLDQLVHAAMGCASETGELAESALAYCEGAPLNLKNINEELGDGMWFVAYCCDVIGITLPELEPVYMVALTPSHVRVPMLSLAMYTLRYNSLGAEVATQVKAHAFYGKALDKEKLQRTLKAYLESIASIAATVGLELDDVLTGNIAKLALRYPGKYSDEAAIARADKGEANVETLLCPTELTAAEVAADAATLSNMDLSKLEARVLANTAQYQDQLNTGRDPHQARADREGITRNEAKRKNFVETPAPLERVAIGNDIERFVGEHGEPRGPDSPMARNYVFVTSDPNAMKADNGDRRYFAIDAKAMLQQSAAAEHIMRQQLKEAIINGGQVIGDTIIVEPKRFSVTGTAAELPQMQEQMKQQLKAAITPESESEKLTEIDKQRDADYYSKPYMGSGSPG